MKPVDSAVSLLTEFKKFALKGSVVDLAVGVIIGGAFGKMVDSLVKHILMPAISIIVPGGGSYSAWKLTILGREIPYGLFIGEVVNFLIVSFALFIFIVKFLGWITRLKKQEAAAPAPPPTPTKDQALLTEIRDLLREGRSSGKTG